MAERVFKLPDLGEGLEAGEIAQWLVDEGDTVVLNQPLVEVNTEKALVEIPSPVAGVVKTLHAQAGDEVAVGAPLVTFEVTEAAEAEGRTAVLVGYGVDTEPAPSAPRGRLRKAPAAPERRGKPLAAPAVRKLAKDLGIDLATVPGTGPEGRITAEDVERAARGEIRSGHAPLPDEDGDERVTMRGIRRVVADRMERAWIEVPHVTTYLTVDATALVELRDELAFETDVKVTALPIVVRALAEVVRDHPKLNAWFDPATREIVLKPSMHAGIATDSPAGLVVPVVRDVAERGILDLAAEIRELVARAREQKAALEELQGSTITVSNVGSFGAEYGTPIVNQPEVAILAIGVIEQRALVVRGVIEARPVSTFSLSFDHRVLDGAEAGRALEALRGLLQDEDRLRLLPR